MDARKSIREHSYPIRHVGKKTMVHNNFQLKSITNPFFFSFFLFQVAPEAYEVPRLGVQSEPAYARDKKCQI